MNEPSIFKLQSIRHFYGEKEALRNLSLEIPSHRVTVLIGPSGCGKSTTLRCLNRMVEPRHGRILFQDKDLAETDPIQLRRKMGYAIQKVGLIPHMTVAENISLVPRLLEWPAEKLKRRVEELLHLIQLDPEEYGSKFPSQLSGGEAQRVGVARALSADPPVLLMDEPFGAVDPLNRQNLQDEFIRIQRQLKKSVIFVTHDLEEALRLADYLVIMKEGQIEQQGSPKSILSAPETPFVEDFLGQDRALKSLTLYTADQFLSESSSTKEQDVLRSDLMGRPHYSLKECLSLMLSTGRSSIPVLSEDNQILGEVKYEDIQRLQSEK